jgi:hypothetical protein
MTCAGVEGRGYQGSARPQKNVEIIKVPGRDLSTRLICAIPLLLGGPGFKSLKIAKNRGFSILPRGHNSPINVIGFA